MSRNIEVYSNIEFLRARLLARDTYSAADEYQRQLERQNAGAACDHCGCESGHKIHCSLINPQAAAEIAELQRIASL